MKYIIHSQLDSDYNLFGNQYAVKFLARPELGEHRVLQQGEVSPWDKIYHEECKTNEDIDHIQCYYNCMKAIMGHIANNKIGLDNIEIRIHINNKLHDQIKAGNIFGFIQENNNQKEL